MIFFVRHYLHRRKVHIRSVKITNILWRHQQGQRRALHQSVCPFSFSTLLLLLLLLRSLRLWWLVCVFFFFCLSSFRFHFFIFVCFSSSGHGLRLRLLRLTYFIVFLFRTYFFFSVSHSHQLLGRLLVALNRIFLSFLLPILCLLFTQDMRVIQIDQRSVQRP